MDDLDSIFSDSSLKKKIISKSHSKKLDKGEVLIFPGEKPAFFPIVLSGVLRIVREDDEGREAFLYHLYPSQTCAMVLNCCQSQKQSMIKAVAENETQVLQVSTGLISRLFKYHEWKEFISTTYSERFSELIKAVDLIAFNDLDEKILDYLKKKKEALGSPSISVTHQQVARDLNTHRESVSRLLRTMERKGIVKLGRNNIELL